MSTSGSGELKAILSRINDNRQAYDRLSNAIFGGSTREVINIITTGLDVSGPIDENGQNILHLASYAGLLDLIVYFMNELSPDKRPHVNTKDFHGWTPLLCAASNGHISVCHFLLTNGADAKITNDQKTTPLHYLCRKKEAASFVKDGRDTTKGRQSKKDSESYFGVLEDLIQAGISVDCRNYMGETPLMQAASKGNEEAVRFLLEHKADIKITNTKGDTALFYATNAGHEPIAKLIAKKKGDVVEKLITHEVRLDHLGEVFSLMKNNDNGVNLSDKRSFFITHRACFSGSELVDWILKNLSIRTRDDASRYAQKYLDSNYIVGISKKKKFKDSISVLYRFASDAPVEEVNANKEEKIGLEHFDQLHVLGRGAFGKVLLVRKKETKKELAMKIIEKSKVMDKPRDFKNLMSEKRILQNDCPFLVHLYYSFQTPTDFYLVMDFLGGGDLNFHLKREKRFTEKIVQFIAAELVLAMAYLHSRGIIYRDLKPQNILLDVDGHICLADFGLSKEVAGSEANLHTACGTPSYSAPEVLEGHPYTKSVDWWSFGICLYQFLVGKTPFHFDGDFGKLVHSVLYEEVQYPSDAISERARSFLQGVLQKNPDKRLDDEDAIKKHPFFTGIDWDKLAVKKVPSPFKVAPNALDNFDPKYTNLAVNERNRKKEIKGEVENFTVIL